MDKLKALLVGAGFMGSYWAMNLHNNSETKLVAWVDVRSEVIAQAANDLAIGDIYTGSDLEKAIVETRPDFVVDTTPPHVHRDVTLLALAAGVPVLGEKPMADSMEHAREMVTAAERAGKLYMVSQNRRYDPDIQALRRLISDEIGPLGILNADYYLGEHSGGFRTDMASPLLVDMAIHTFDAARYLSGADPISVYCDEFNPLWSWYKGNACASAIFEMTDGLRFTYRGSRCGDGWPTTWDAEWRAVGPNGTAIWDGRGTPVADVVVDVKGNLAQTRKVNGRPLPDLTKGLEGSIAGSLRTFVRALHVNVMPMTECHDNIKSLAMVFAAIESSATGLRVPIAPLLT
jgi:predicted dehydrogenase